MLLDDICKELKKTRKDMGITQKELSESVGISRRTVINLENGNIDDIGFNNISAIASFLGYSFDMVKKNKLNNNLSTINMSSRMGR